MKLFVAVGTQLPFPRLVDEVAAIVARREDIECDAQVGAMQREALPDCGGRLRAFATLGDDAFREAVASCDVFVSHAGIGSVLLARELGTAHVVMPREAARGEHRNDHQQDTARWLAELGGVRVAWSAQALEDEIERAAAGVSQPGAGAAGEGLERLRDFVRRVVASG